MLDAACWVSWEGIETPYWKGPSWRPISIAYFHDFFIHWPLSPISSSVSWCWSCFVCSGLTYEIYSEGGPSTYVYCVVCYRVIAAPYVRSVVMSLHTVTLLMTIPNTQNGLSSRYSLNVFPITLGCLPFPDIKHRQVCWVGRTHFLMIRQPQMASSHSGWHHMGRERTRPWNIAKYICASHTMV